MTLPTVSIIIPTYNREDKIGNCLESVTNVDYPKNKIEIVVVDDGSIDQTKEIVTKFPVKFLRQKHKGPAMARNNGIEHSRGKIIVFTDSDCVVPRGWLKGLVAGFADKKVAGVGGSINHIDNSFAVKYEQYRRYLLYGDLKDNIFSNGFRYLPTCNLAIRRSIIDKVGLFDVTFGYAAAEDVDFCYRIFRAGGVVTYKPNVKIKHYHAQNWGKIAKRRFVQAKEILRFYEKRKLTKKLWLNYGISFVYLVVLPSLFISQLFFVSLLLMTLVPHIKNLRKVRKKINYLPFVLVDYFMYYVDSFAKFLHFLRF